MSEDHARSNFLAIIIEDAPELATIFEITLQGANYETEIVQDGQLAIQRLAVIVPDVVILDLHLPLISGIDVLKQIRADQRLAQTQVIIITADLFRAEALRDQADAILIKPVSLIRLRDLVTNLSASRLTKPSE